MKRKLLFCLCFITSSLVFTQNVCVGNFTLNSQTDVANLASNTCETIEGSIIINSTSLTDPITDLSSLTDIQIITESLVITQNSVLANLNGLNNLTAVGPQFPNGINNSGSLSINNNQNLSSIEALSGLTFLRNLFIFTNASLSSLDGLQNIINITSTLQINDNAFLENFDGLNGLIGGDQGLDNLFVNISDNQNLINIDGLGNWSIEISDLTIVNNPMLSSIKGLSEVSSTGNNNSHDITDNTSLSDFCGLFQFASSATTNTLVINNNAGSSSQQQIIENGSCYTLIPNIKFENALISKGIDSEGFPTNGKILNADIENRTFLNLTGNLGTIPETNPNNIIRLDIEDISGIEGFTSLETLFIQGNDLVNVDLSNNLNLIDVRAFNNDGLQSINITGLANLEIIGLNSNMISSIDVSTNTRLKTFHIAENNLTELDITGLNDLADVNLKDNPQLVCVQVLDASTASILNNDTDNFRRNGTTVFSSNCFSSFLVDVFVMSGQAQDTNGNYIITPTSGPIQVGFNLEDENGNELTTSDLVNYIMQINTVEATQQNPAQGGNINTPGVDFELLTNEGQQVITKNNGTDGHRFIAMRGDGLFEADEYFYIDVSTNDTNISIKDAINGVVQIPVKIVDNEQTDITLTLEQNGAEPNQNATLRITSSLQNDTGAPMPFNVTLGGGPSTAILGEDYLDLANQPSIANGESFVEFDVIILNNDSEAETEEEFFADISYVGDITSNRVNLLVGTAGTEVPIIDDGNVDNTTFTVSTSLNGAGTSPNYVIEEGETFTINFDADNTAVNATEYNPSIDFSINGTSSTEDFFFNGETTIPNQFFTVNNTGSDGQMIIQAKEDGIQEGDEVYTITISSSNANQYTLAAPTTFTVTVKDKSISSGDPFSVTTSLSGANGSNPFYTIDEGGSFSLNFNAEQIAQAGDTYSVTVDYQTFYVREDKVNIVSGMDLVGQQTNVTRTPQSNSNDIILENANSQYTFTVDDDDIDGSLNFLVVDDSINEGIEEIVVNITINSTNVTLKNTSTYIIKINPSDPIELDVFLEQAGVPNQYSITEGEDFNLIFSPNKTSEESFNLILDLDQSSATPGDYEGEYNDFYMSPAYYEFTKNFDDSYDFDFTESIDDLIIPIYVQIDSFQNENEEIVITLPKPSDNFFYKNANTDGDLVFTIPIVDIQPITFSASIEDLNPNGDGVYEVTEGEDFVLLLNPEVSDGFLNQNAIPLNIQTIGSVADRNIDYQIESYYKSISLYNPNRITFSTTDDNIPDDDELIIITLPKPNGPYQWENDEVDGSLIFQVLLKDKVFDSTIEDYTISLENEGETIPLNGSTITLQEDDLLYLSISSLNGSDLEKGFLISTRDGTAKLADNDFFNYIYSSSDINSSVLFTYSEGFSLSFADFEEENTENFFIDITPTTDNYNLLRPDGSKIQVGETYSIKVNIENVEHYLITNNSKHIIDFITPNAIKTVSTDDPFVNNYIVTERDTIEILLSSILPENRNGDEFSLGYTISDNNSGVSTADYEFSLVNGAGENLVTGNTNGGSFSFVVDNTTDYNAKIRIILKEDNIDEKGESLSLTLIPDIELPPEPEPGDATPPGPGTVLAGFQSASQPRLNLNYKFLINDFGEKEIIYAVLSNSGGIEGVSESPDIITCTLVDKNGDEYTDHTGTIEIPIEDRIDENDLLRINPWEYKFDSMVFVFSPGESKASIKVSYFDERVSENGPLESEDIDCNYYDIRLKEPTQSAGENIIYNRDWKTIKVIDKTGFLVFVELVLNENIKPIAFDSSDPYYEVAECEGDCLNYYEIEEDTDLEFTIDAANGILENTKYTVRYNISQQDNNSLSSKTIFKKDTDYEFLNTREESNIPVYVNPKDEDLSIFLNIKEDYESDDGERFTLNFDKESAESTYQLSKRNDRSYGSSFSFRVLDAIPINAKTNSNYTEIDEEDINSYGEIILELDEKPSTELTVRFELSGTAQHGVTNDYIITSKNKNVVKIYGNQGIIYLRAGQQSAELTLMPVNDDDDERLETIKFELIDDFGYSLGSPFTELTIVDEDKTDYEASIISEDFAIFENRTNTYTEEIVFQLTPENSSEAEIRIDFSFDSSVTNAVLTEDYKLFEIIEGQPKREILTSEDYYLTVPIEGETAKLEIETIEDQENEGDDPEGDEQIKINLEASDQYFANNQSITITIKDNPKDGENPTIDTNGILAQVTSSACVDAKKGRISMINGSDLNYKVSLYSNQEAAFIGQPVTLKANQLSFEELFKDLSEGSYSIYLAYDLNEGEEPPEIELPSFTLTVKTATQVKLIKNSSAKGLKIANLKISGSTTYHVKNNGINYDFNSNSTAAIEIELPLQYGQNNIVITGDSECQGVVKTSIMYDDLLTYPNPTVDMVYMAGFEVNSKLKVQLLDVAGKIVADKEVLLQSSTLEIDMTPYTKGVYICKISHENGMSSIFKLVKK